MGRKKALSGVQTQETFELRPFCYYCDRDFDSVKTLVQHQRTKHFKCAECGLSFDTVTGLRVHMLNAYKRTMKEVPNAVGGRDNPDIVVHGMEGIPKRVLEEKTREAMAERAEKDRIREEETKERNKARGAEESSKPASQKRPPAPEAPEPPAPGSAPPLPPSAPANPGPAVPAEARPQAPSSPGPPPLPPGSQPQPQRLAAPQRLSPAVAELLAPKPRAQDSLAIAAVPGLPGHVVPPALSALHPVALQVLAVAGVLLPPRPPISLGQSGTGPAGFAGILTGALRGGCAAGAAEPAHKRLRAA